MEINKYKWFIQDNGLCTVLDVPVFRPYDDTKRINGKFEEGRGRASLSDLAQAIQTVQKQQEMGHYLRVHLGHHETMENRPGVGFLDNFRLVGNEIIVDLCEMPQEIIEELKESKKKYPYRSMEYLWKEKKFVGLALLESQAPFFIFPMLVVEDQPQLQHQVGEIPVLFQMKERERKGVNMAIRDGDLSDKDRALPGPDDTAEGDASTLGSDDEIEKMGCSKMQGGMDAITKGIEEIKEMLQSLFEMEKNEDEGGSEGEEGEGEGEEMGKEESPSSVAYQKLVSRVRRLERNKADQNLESKMFQISQSTGIPLSSIQKDVAQFSSYKDQERFLGIISSSWPKHAMTENLERGQMRPTTKAENLIQKFQANSIQEGKWARTAVECYKDMISQANKNEVKKFAAAWHFSPDSDPWGGLERFVMDTVENCKSDPRFLDRLTSI